MARPAMARRAKMTTGDWMPSAELGYRLIVGVVVRRIGLEGAKKRRDWASRRDSVEERWIGRAAIAP